LVRKDPHCDSDEIIVTASALPEEVEATPAAATVVTCEEIEARAARDVADVLREVPGLVVSRTGSQGRATSLFTRGSNSNHTLVLWNGIEITNPYFADYDWGRFSTIGVEQVEVVRGPYSALYGSDAVAGVVNVLTTSHHFGLATNRFENVGAANAQGVELALERRLTSALRTSLSYTFTETEEEGANRPLARRPRLTRADFAPTLRTHG
jgi:vitamin B12 transporter